jgi:hypothetical protein
VIGARDPDPKGRCYVCAKDPDAPEEKAAAAAVPGIFILFPNPTMGSLTASVPGSGMFYVYTIECIRCRAHNGGSTITNNQSYKLYPNPNGGTFTLQQMVSDGEPVQIEAWDAIGQSIYNQQAVFSAQRLQLQLGDMLPGLYMLQLTDSKGLKYSFKFVVEK